MIHRYAVLSLLFFGSVMVGRGGGFTSSDELGPIAVGNLSLPGSQRPKGLFAFGQSVIDKGEFLGYFYFNDLHGCNKRLVDGLPSVLYGLTNKISLSFNIPLALTYKQNGSCSKGIEDIFIGAQFSLGSRATKTAVDGFSLAFDLYLPTGSASKQPPTGLGSPSFFAGISAGHLSADWYFYVDLGGLFTTTHHGKKPGNRFYYQWGLGRNIKSPPGWIYAAIVEFLGRDDGYDKICNQIDCTSGGNIYSIAPQIWISSERFLFQLGITIPMHQHYVSPSNRQKFLLSGGIGYRF